uniref:TBC1 domain family member 10B n=1 Tax=Ascaris suum TaxID=6253 RepID=F1KRD5_ASCSU
MDVGSEDGDKSSTQTASRVSTTSHPDAFDALSSGYNHNLTATTAVQRQCSDSSFDDESTLTSSQTNRSSRRVGQQMNVSQDDESTLTSSQTNRSSRGVADGIVEDDDEDTERHQPCSSDFFQTTKIDEFGFIRSPDSKLTVSSRSATVDLVTLRKREKKWLYMLSNWSHFMNNKYEKVRERCRKGIPPSLRGRAWKHLCGATFHMEFSVNRHVFEEVSAQAGDQRWVDDIKKDLNRQFPEHVMFSRSGPYGKGGKKDLFELLKAYTVLHPEEGYCQGQAPIASVLLMHMPLRDAFYCFVQICHKYLPGYYSAGLEAIQIDGDILFQLLKEKSKLSYRHLKKHHVEPMLYMVEWFMCIYCRTLPWPTVLRIWDMFFCEGVKVLFKVAVVLLRYGLGTNEQLKEFNDFHSTVTRLKNLPYNITNEDFLINKVSVIDILINSYSCICRLDLNGTPTFRKREFSPYLP